MFKRHPQNGLEPIDTRGWQTRTIVLIGDRPYVNRVCADWSQEGWQVMTIDTDEPSPSGQPTFLIRVAVPPPGWLTPLEILGHALD